MKKSLFPFLSTKTYNSNSSTPQILLFNFLSPFGESTRRGIEVGVGLLLLLLLFTTTTFAHDLPHNLVTVNMKIVEADTKKVTPVMMCIQNAKTKEVVVPPYGKVVKEFSTVDDFVSGIMFSSDPNWVGPVRKTTGKGAVDQRRSFEYDLAQPVPYWKAPALYQTSGNFSINLKPGKWLVSISHGYEYIPVLMEEFIVPDDDHTFDIQYTLNRWVDMPSRGWFSGDVHVHHPTTKPEYRDFLINFAKAENLHIANTLNMGYHHQYGDSKSGIDFEQQGFGKKFRTRSGNHWLVSGQEDPRSKYGHIIGLNLSKFERDTLNYDYYDRVFENIHKQPGALVGFAHLAFNGCEILQGLPWFITTNEIDFIEILQLTKINALGYYDYLNLGFRITAAAGSDLPWAATIGEVRTYVYTGKRFTPDKWFKGMKKGNTFVSNGPMLFFEADGKLPGTELKVAKGQIAKLRVEGLGQDAVAPINRVAIYNNDGLVQEVKNLENKNSVKLDIDLPINKSQWLVAVAYCNNDAVAHTTPVYYVVDNHPTWSPENAAEIICRHMQMMDDVEAETTDSGIVKRLNSARAFYRKMLKAMNVEELKYETVEQKIAKNTLSAPRKLEKVKVEGGSFIMGDPFNNGDQPMHVVTLSDFEISTTEVTNYQFAEFLNANKIDISTMFNNKSMVLAAGAQNRLSFVDNAWKVTKGYDNYPVINVTWPGAVEFSKWVGGRLPTEAEWEYAAKGGKMSKNYTFSGSDDVKKVAWIGLNSIARPNEVATLMPNELGIYDMSGNVNEWCADWYDIYPKKPVANPKGPETGDYRIFRGGSHREVDSNSRVTRRNAFYPDAGLSLVGFRVAF